MENNNHFNFCSTLEELYSANMAVTKSGELIEAKGLSSVNNLITLRGVLQSIKARDTLEVGLAYGGSALAMLSTLAELNEGGTYSHFAIDPFQSDFDEAGVAMVEKAGFGDQFTWVEDASEFALPQLFKEGKRFDFIYIDGSHLFEHVFIDAFFSTMLLNDGGVMLFDDCVDPHVDKVIKFLKKNMGDHLEKFDLLDFGVQKSKPKQVANRLGYAQLKGFRKVGDLPRKWDSKFHRF